MIGDRVASRSGDMGDSTGKEVCLALEGDVTCRAAEGVDRRLHGARGQRQRAVAAVSGSAARPATDVSRTFSAAARCWTDRDGPHAVRAPWRRRSRTRSWPHCERARSERNSSGTAREKDDTALHEWRSLIAHPITSQLFVAHVLERTIGGSVSARAPSRAAPGGRHSKRGIRGEEPVSALLQPSTDGEPRMTSH